MAQIPTLAVIMENLLHEVKEQENAPLHAVENKEEVVEGSQKVGEANWMLHAVEKRHEFVETSQGSIRCIKTSDGHEDLIDSKELFELVHDDTASAVMPSSTTLLQRVGQLDDIICALEQKTVAGCSLPSLHSETVATFKTCPSSASSNLEKRCKPTEAVMEEVEAKGTLVERITLLEMRILELDRSLQGIVSAKAADFMQHHDSARPIASSLVDLQSKHSENVLPAIEKHEVLMDVHKEAESSVTHITHIGDKQDIEYEMESTLQRSETRREHRQYWTKSQGLGRWLKTKFHSSLNKHCSNGQGNAFSERHCWDLHSRSRHCWNFRKGVLHPSPDRQNEKGD